MPFALTGQNIKVWDNFEGDGTIYSWFGADCTIDVIFNNPYREAGNYSATVLKYDDTGGLSARAGFDVNGFFDLSTHPVFYLKIYIPSPEITGNQDNQISFILQDGKSEDPGSTQSAIIQPLLLDQWQTVTFDFANDTYINADPESFPPAVRNDFNRVVIQINGVNNTDQVVAFLDDINFNGSLSSGFNDENLIWADEFSLDGPVDPNKWFHQTLLPNGSSWYNGEIQHYTDRIDNSYVEDGFLKIVAKKETYTDQGVTKNYTSARLNSKFAFTYGRVEIRAKLPTGTGTWAALWTLGKNTNEKGAYWYTQGFGTTSWPASGEIDILEHWGNSQNFVQSAMHTPSSHGATVNKGGRTIPTVSTEFHTYVMDWTPEKIVFSVDGIVHYTYNPEEKNEDTWPYDWDQYLIMNIAIQSSIDVNFTESPMEIDFVRIYDINRITGVKENVQKNIRIYPNPVRDVLTLNLASISDAETLIRIYSLEGKLVKSYSDIRTNSRVLLDNLDDLNEGIYLLKIIGEEQIFDFKIVKKN